MGQHGGYYKGEKKKKKKKISKHIPQHSHAPISRQVPQVNIIKKGGNK